MTYFKVTGEAVFSSGEISAKPWPVGWQFAEVLARPKLPLGGKGFPDNFSTEQFGANLAFRLRRGRAIVGFCPIELKNRCNAQHSLGAKQLP